MKVGQVYLAQIYTNKGTENGVFCSEFLKKAVVYPYSIFTGRYRDLFSGEIYNSSIHDVAKGDVYINLMHGLIPICNYQCLDMRYNDRLSEEAIKTRVLKKYDQGIGN